jgi:FG-GAP repeat protein
MAHQPRNRSTHSSRALIRVAAAAAALAMAASPGWGQTELTRIMRPGGSYAGFFGWSVSASNGEVLVGERADRTFGPQHGSAHLFRSIGGSWVQEAFFLPSYFYFNLFGNSVSLDGDIAAVGAPGEGLFTSSGSVHVFRRSAGFWQAEGVLLASDAAQADVFGSAVAVSGDAIAVGAPMFVPGTKTGAAYVFRWNGFQWLQEMKLVPPDTTAAIQFGSAVALRGDVMVIGAPSDPSMGNGSGSAYVFRRVAGVWIEEAKLLPAGLAVADEFGTSVDLDGDAAIVGSPGSIYPHVFPGLKGRAGSAHVFRDGGGSWIEEARLEPPDGEALDRFGSAVSLSGDRALVGADLQSAGGLGSGAAYVFRLARGAWRWTAKLVAAESSSGSRVGSAVSLAGTTAFVGAYADAAGGSVYVFDVTSAVDGVLNLLDAVDTVGPLGGVETGLVARLEAAIRALSDGGSRDDATAAGALRAFINTVEAQSGIGIAESDAAALIAAAQAILSEVRASP